MYYLLDTGFWIALYNPAKEPKRNSDAEIIAELIENEKIIIPFPTLYEFLNSKFSRKEYVHRFEKLISRPNFIKVYDKDYRDKALESFFINKSQTINDVSLVDEVIKAMIEDVNLKVDCLVTFDEGLKNFALSKGITTI